MKLVDSIVDKIVEDMEPKMMPEPEVMSPQIEEDYMPPSPVEVEMPSESPTLPAQPDNVAIRVMVDLKIVGPDEHAVEVTAPMNKKLIVTGMLMEAIRLIQNQG